MAAQSISIHNDLKAASEPISARERILEIDILRGFALFGILLVNMASYGHSFYEYVMFNPDNGNFLDQAAAFLIAFLGEGKFYSLFSFLFGFGLAIQMSRAEARGAKFVPLYLRRILVLLGIGLIHAYLIWVGDILVPYAVLGLLLLLFRKSRPKTLLIWSIAMLSIIILINLGALGLTSLARLAPGGAEMMEQATQEALLGYQNAAEQANQVYSSGNFAQLTSQRALDLGFVYPVTLLIAPNIFAMFLLGLAAGKKGIFNNIQAHLPFFRKLQLWGLVIGVAGNLAFAVAGRLSNPSVPSLYSLLASFGQTIGAPMLSAFYVASIILLSQNPAWRSRLAILAPVGRMALSNYLLQSLICTTIFYSYGLGLYGQVGAAVGVLLSIGIYLFQIPISHWWMKRFKFGPVEWLWRTLTYGRVQKMKEQAT